MVKLLRSVFFLQILTLLMLGWGWGEFLDFSSSWFEISLHAEFQFPMLPVSGPKVCGRLWVGGGGGGGGGGV